MLTPARSSEKKTKMTNRNSTPQFSSNQNNLLNQNTKTLADFHKPGDEYEQEADQVAEEIMRPSGIGRFSIFPPDSSLSIQKKCATCEGGGGGCPKCAEEGEQLQRKPFIKPVVQSQVIDLQEDKEAELLQTKLASSSSTSVIQRQPVEFEENDEEEILQTKRKPDRLPHLGSNLTDQVKSVLGRGGQPLPESERNFFEHRFGHSFANVRVHNEAESGWLAQKLNARAFTLRNNVVFGSGQYVPGSDEGRKLMAHELAHVVQQNQHGPLSIQRAEEGPQSFAGAEPGEIQVDPDLMSQNRTVEQELFDAADRFLSDGDLRWFFSYAHAKITQQINNNIGAFQRPNALIRLNLHFGRKFIRALNGEPHEKWQEAFRFCQVLQQSSEETSLLAGEAELCGAKMANIHINIDLRAAINEIGCIPTADYGNMLVFVTRGSLAALVRLRGRTLGAAEAIFQHVVAPLVDLEVKTWRNATYESICNATVPNPDPNFLR